MQKVMNTLRKNSGYVSIETVIVAGLIIGLGAFAITSFQEASNGVRDTAIDQVKAVQTNYENLPQATE
ncbi:hypothetical protein CVD28_04865 [Bacillus sp. M6-12]|uniref:hypothetical protein n=1 Tax=Bacillus sp. M6-12 TaxID=2054166 RepID=UPI000C758C97|nr:hypothetical protein [Bacillus sp. M6-12]PLS19745.1 hypothetical protein CVD28_04865 [Bacillus sp. M6-12]